MRLMNAELSESLKKFPLYSQDGKKADAVVVASISFQQPPSHGTSPRAGRRMMTISSLVWWSVLTPAQKWAISPFPSCLN